jgi:hypothetical protein
VASRTSEVGNQDPGEVATAAFADSLPGGWLGYAEITADQSGITSLADITGLSQAVTVNSDRRIKITVHGRIQTTSATDRNSVVIREGSTQLQVVYDAIPDSVNPSEAFEGSVILTPSAGSHTYKVSAQRVTGTGTVTFGAAATAPAFILIEDIGPAS